MDAAITPRDDVRRVLVAGDTHGNTASVQGLIHTAAAHDCPIVSQVGDFGYFRSLAVIRYRAESPAER
jgi:hypothetical protein